MSAPTPSSHGRVLSPRSFHMLSATRQPPAAKAADFTPLWWARCCRERSTQAQFQKRRPGYRVVAIRGRRFESKGEIEPLRVLHRGQRIQEQSLISELPAARNDGLGQSPSQAAAARAGHGVEALDLTRACRKMPQPDAAELRAALLG